MICRQSMSRLLRVPILYQHKYGVLAGFHQTRHCQTRMLHCLENVALHLSLAWQGIHHLDGH